ncbi:MAG TPA: site-specific DNA-methyltransferase, partial [Chthonomonadales bacterium]|nr:site-specific DNA-methyltransferase [Chthonomonadales bacterium]
MPPAKKKPAEENVLDLRYDVKRKNLPPAGMVARGNVDREKKLAYAYNPHLPPTLRFDATGRADRVNDLLAKLAAEKRLTDSEIAELQALAQADPYLEWAGKREELECLVDPVALQIHERISAQAILKVAARQDVPHSLFADPELDYREAVQFYQHDVDWSNRMILGDSLAVMASLARREALKGRVQMIYMDPPYGIRYASNFQSQVGNRDVKDKEEDLTREPEMIKAYRDTWNLGVHSYLSYLRDRLVLAKELLSDTGSIFVQIGDDNVHRLRAVLDDVFGPDSSIALIAFATTSAIASRLLGKSSDFLLWYAKDSGRVKYRSVFKRRALADDTGIRWTRIEGTTGERRPMTSKERGSEADELRATGLVHRSDNLTSQGSSETGRFEIAFEGHSFRPAKGTWKTSPAGIARLRAAARFFAPTPNSLNYVRFYDDFPHSVFSNVWNDTQTGAFTDEKVYAVQTATTVVGRCMLMTTDPGDLVLDPTCGSGTTAYVAEQWGRRWITIDTSRVAIAISRQRLLTARYDHYRMRSLSAEDLVRNP